MSALPPGSVLPLVGHELKPLAASRDPRAIESAARLLNTPVTGNLMHACHTDSFGECWVPIPGLSAFDTASP